jgi:hypothetical protein
LIGTCKGVPAHASGRVFTDLAVAVADGADAISGIGVLTDREELSGPVASMPATWRVLDRVGPGQLPAVRAARAKARAAAWAAGAGPDLGEELRLDFDATITIAHSEKQNAAATWKKTFGPSVAVLPGSRPCSPRSLCGVEDQPRLEHREGRQLALQAGHPPQHAEQPVTARLRDLVQVL